ncbi:MAG TPA: metalloregulator ArsR/SmtB family transcription factor [Anaerolineae bacterium]|nr:metalloregulator ArsR/SmtB family transcription factor [Anaerolineae bacterium]
MREALGHGVALALAETFKALSDPTRIKIICALAEWELCVGELGATLDMSESAVSHQLSFLRSMRIVKFRKEGRRVYYSVDDEHIEQLLSQRLEHIAPVDVG